MNCNRAGIPLLLFAKEPVAGKVKTRLTAYCDPEQAAGIAKILMEQSIKMATAHWPGLVYLCVWQFDKAEQHPFISKMLASYNVQLLVQVDGNLGDKMLSAFTAVSYPAAIMGCDAPLVTKDTFNMAYRAMQSSENIIGPCVDGGYYLIGLSQAAPSLFVGLDWGTETVLSDTLALAKSNDVEFIKMPESYDVDRWDDVIRASKSIPILRAYLHSENLDH